MSELSEVSEVSKEINDVDLLWSHVNKEVIQDLVFYMYSIEFEYRM
ncbi:MAG: hypothetical protein GTO45_30470 [Candidatus Aminicenantes bacterium]|nr:hypothetical protein [Candidatus Aminicenantes bacterium]NIR10040.1 hypothetical protein [Candidatus Aminicenantes bacterium]